MWILRERVNSCVALEVICVFVCSVHAQLRDRNEGYVLSEKGGENAFSLVVEW